MRLLNIYGQPMEHMDVEIIGNKAGLAKLRDTLQAAIKAGEATTEDDVPLFASDGEGYTVKVICNEADWLSHFWKEHPAFYHRVLD